MPNGSISLGRTPLGLGTPAVSGGFKTLEGEPWYRIEHVDRMPPFFMSVVSDSDHWLFVSSRGGLTAGRRNAEHALFPYTTDDRVHDSSGARGPVTVLHVTRGTETSLWEPFQRAHQGVYDCTQSLYKTREGDRLLFEEVNRSLGLTFRYEWATSERFGFVRRASLVEHGLGPVAVRVLDGVLDVLPAGVERRMQSELSTLVDAYKRCELEPDGLALYRLSSIPVDRAEPSEALAVTTIWSLGLPGAKHLLCAAQLDTFRRGAHVHEESDVRGVRGAYLLAADVQLATGGIERWALVAEVEQDACAVVALKDELERSSADSGRALAAALAEDIALGTRRLTSLVARADGLQFTGDPLEDTRHFANTLFNIMRGGVFSGGYSLPGPDLAAFVREVAPVLAAKHGAWLRTLPAELSLTEARSQAEATGDVDLARVVAEYLPLSFSRRHGDPSRPWNVFSIEVRQRTRSPYSYQGNWRDIFQNWEALCASFPGFASSVVARFVNSSTADGYNPYRISRQGFEWEVPDPADPWAFIGYWGDHQLVYLVRLLELWRRHEPEALGATLGQARFVYADVPYRIATYSDTLADPTDTIHYDEAHARTIGARVAAEGHEGRLVRGRDGHIVRVTLAEKLLLPVLVKLSNLVPDVGVWLNTQRPEWNDANNALVGRGASVVTLCHLRSALALYIELFDGAHGDAVLTVEVAELLGALGRALAAMPRDRRSATSSLERRKLTDSLGEAGSAHRVRLYTAGFSGDRARVPYSTLGATLRAALAAVDASLASNVREDGLLHAYNLIVFEPGGGLGVRRLPLMLEGQVALLGAGTLDSAATLALLAALRRSELFRADQHSYLLYPDRVLPRFMEKNRVAPGRAAEVPLLTELIDRGDTSIVRRDVDGWLHFAPALRNARVLAQRLDELEKGALGTEVRSGRAAVASLYEEVFDHAAFTGRSGTFYGYEGLGCIYWHQVSKLLLVAHEALQRARDGASGALAGLLDGYMDLRAGLGTHKSPALYGAFPTDPYSHTPSFAGARQPGMTGQVKEDFLTRLAELGVRVVAGHLVLGPCTNPAIRWREDAGTFVHEDVSGATRTIEVPRNAVAYTVFQVPVVATRGGTPSITVWRLGGERRTSAGLRLDLATSQSLFERRGEVTRLEVTGL